MVFGVTVLKVLCFWCSLYKLTGNAQTTTRAVGIAYRLWLHFSINGVLDLIKLRSIIGSIWGQQLFRSLRGHQHSSDQMKILKEQIISLVATLLNQQRALFNEVKEYYRINLRTASASLFEGSSAQLRSNEDLEGAECSNYY